MHKTSYFFPNFSQNDAIFPNSKGPGPIPRKGCESPELKSHFYKVRDNIHLSASGTRGLLGCIHQHVHIVENFQQCAYTGPWTQNDKRSQS